MSEYASKMLNELRVKLSESEERNARYINQFNGVHFRILELSDRLKSANDEIGALSREHECIERKNKEVEALRARVLDLEGEVVRKDALIKSLGLDSRIVVERGDEYTTATLRIRNHPSHGFPYNNINHFEL